MSGSAAIDEAPTLPRFVRAIAAAYGNSPAIRLGDDAIGFAELDRTSALLARGLMAIGVGKGSRVAFLAGNGPCFAVWLFAIARAGGVAIPLSTLLKADELVRVLRQSDAAILLVQRHLLGHDHVERLCDALPELREAQGNELRIARVPFLRSVFSSGTALPAAIADLAMLDEAARDVGENLLDAASREIHPSDQAIEIYTSGSMAAPKGVRHDHGAMIERTGFLTDMLAPGRGEERAAVLPMFWVGGLMIALMPNLAAGAVTLCSERPASDSRFAMGSVLAAEDLSAIENRPYWALGMSETLGPYSWGDTFRVPGRPVCAPIDHVAPGFTIRVVDAAGDEVGDGETGEIEIRGAALSPGLHKLDRADFYTPDGFYRTGDLGLVDGERIHFVGRRGDVIKTAGSNVSPAEVEMEMQSLDGVHSAYVVGLPDAERGERVVAAVVARAGAVLDFEAIRTMLRSRLSAYKVPRDYIAIARDEVPLLASNKVDRRAIEAMLARRLRIIDEV